MRILILICVLASAGLAFMSAPPSANGPINNPPVAGKTAESPQTQVPDSQALLCRWAPVLIQEIEVQGEQSLDGRADYVVAADYDSVLGAMAGNTTLDNWDNLPKVPKEVLKPVAYDWLVISAPNAVGSRLATLGYAFYHARDWSSTGLAFLTHENDLEAVILFVELPPPDASDSVGILRGAVTVAHTRLPRYVPILGGWESRHGAASGALPLQEVDGVLRPVVIAEAQGHAIRAWNGTKPEGPFITYTLGTVPEAPSAANGTPVTYSLIDIHDSARGLYRFRQPDSDSLPGNNGWGSANLPTAWRDAAHRDLQCGAIANDPVAVASYFFSIPNAFPSTYEANPFIPNHLVD